MFDYQLNFNDDTKVIGSKEAFAKICSEDLETWCREAQRCKELEHGSETQEEKGQFHKQAALAKNHLPKIMWQASFPEHRRKKDKAVANGLFIYDWDGIWDKSVEETVQEVFERYQAQGKDFIAEEKVMMIHYTPSRHGIRLVCVADPELDIRGNQERLAERLAIPATQRDEHVFDLSRVSYGVPFTKDWVVFCDDNVFTYFNQEYSDRYSTYGKEETVPERKADNSQKIGKSSEESGKESGKVELSEKYLGIPYADIIARWWKLYYGGQEPVTSNRNTLIFELACNLRHICAFSREQLDYVIPNYDNFSQEEKMQCIDNALKEKRSRMPARLSAVLNSIKAEHIDEPELVQAFDEAEELDEMFYLNKLRDLPLGVRDSMQGVKPSLGMPILIGIGPAIGALATGVKLKVHGKFKNLNLQAYIVGEAGSDKSEIGPVFDSWVWKILEEDRRGHELEEAYEEQAKLAKNSKQQPKNPHPAIRYQSMRTSNAMLLYRLKYAEGKHLVSFTSESDLFSQNAKQSWADTSVLVRLAYDGDKYSSDYKSDSAVNGVIEHVLWNMTLCCTPDALYHSVRNYTNGEVTRLAIARTPDNTFSPYVDYGTRSEEAYQNIREVGELLMLLNGDVELPELENRCQEWLEKIRLSMLKNFDRIGAQLRMRVAITAMRYTCCLMLCSYIEWLLNALDRKKGAKCKWAHGCKTAKEFLLLHPSAFQKQLQQFQTEAMLDNYEVLADYMLDNLEYYFKDKIEIAKSSQNYAIGERIQAGRNDSLYNQLSDKFTFNDARRVKGSGVSDNSVKQMLKNWKKQGLIITIDPGKYKKIYI